MTPRMLLALSLAACTHDGGPTGDDTDGGAPPATWSGGVHPLLVEACRGCHQGSVPMALSGDPATDYDTVLPYTDTGDPEGSTLYEAATGLAHATVFPVGSAEAEVLRSWMAAGARED